MNLDNFIINIQDSIIDALKKINMQDSALTLFVVDSKGVIKGTITDGDIRRGFINGLKLEDALEKFIFKEFSFLNEKDDNFFKLKKFRKAKLKAVPVVDSKGRLKKIYDFSKIKSILPIDAVIMAGGLGSRLKPLTDSIPKPLLRIGNKEIISYNFDRLYQFGINNQFVTVNYLGEQIESFCDNYNEDINFKIIKEPTFYGTAGALTLIENFKNNVVLLMNSDLLTNIDYEDFYKSFLEEKADMMVASIPYQINLPYAILNEENKEVKSLKEKPNFTYFANAGIYLVKKELINLIPKNEYFNATDFMELVIKYHKKLIHFPIHGYWLDIGNPDDFEKAQKDISHIDFD